MTITDFLLARIADDEERAKDAAATNEPDEWENPTATGNHWPTNVAFWDEFTPARVLAECAAKRAIIDAWSPPSETDGWAVDGYESAYHAGLHRALVALAAVHFDHPDYQEEWVL